MCTGKKILIWLERYLENGYLVERGYCLFILGMPSKICLSFRHWWLHMFWGSTDGFVAPNILHFVVFSLLLLLLPLSTHQKRHSAAKATTEKNEEEKTSNKPVEVIHVCSTKATTGRHQWQKVTKVTALQKRQKQHSGPKKRQMQQKRQNT